jgi:hypothetical protein
MIAKVAAIVSSSVVFGSLGAFKDSIVYISSGFFSVIK